MLDPNWLPSVCRNCLELSQNGILGKSFFITFLWSGCCYFNVLACFRTEGWELNVHGARTLHFQENHLALCNVQSASVNKV